MRAWWDSLPTTGQDALLLALLICPAVVTGLVVLRGYAPGRLLWALIRANRWVSLTFVLLIALAVAIGTGLTAQERGLRQGSAQAAEKFDLIVSAPGSEITVMFAAVYLQPTDMPLLDGPTYAAVANHPRVDLAAPIAFGDSYGGAPVVGTTPQFVTHLAPDLSDGRMFATTEEAVIGAKVPLEVGDQFSPAHGVGDTAEDGAHGDFAYAVVGKMPAHGSPWDTALLVPVESVWEIHGLANGHGVDWDGTLGPPFDPTFFPGTPAILVRAEALWANYALRSEFSTERMMAFFPGAVLARLHGLMGDIREVMSGLAILTQILVAASSLAALTILTRLLARRFAVLRAIGAPRRFIFALTWSYASLLIATGAVLGLGLGVLASHVISAVISARTDILVRAGLGWQELHLVAGFVSVTVILALLPAALALRRPVVVDLRG